MPACPVCRSEQVVLTQDQILYVCKACRYTFEAEDAMIQNDELDEVGAFEQKQGRSQSRVVSERIRKRDRPKVINIRIPEIEMTQIINQARKFADLILPPKPCGLKTVDTYMAEALSGNNIDNAVAAICSRVRHMDEQHNDSILERVAIPHRRRRADYVINILANHLLMLPKLLGYHIWNDHNSTHNYQSIPNTCEMSDILEVNGLFYSSFRTWQYQIAYVLMNHIENEGRDSLLRQFLVVYDHYELHGQILYSKELDICDNQLTITENAVLVSIGAFLLFFINGGSSGGRIRFTASGRMDNNLAKYFEEHPELVSKLKDKFPDDAEPDKLIVKPPTLEEKNFFTTDLFDILTRIPPGDQFNLFAIFDFLSRFFKVKSDFGRITFVFH